MSKLQPLSSDHGSERTSKVLEKKQQMSESGSDVVTGEPRTAGHQGVSLLAEKIRRGTHCQFVVLVLWVLDGGLFFCPGDGNRALMSCSSTATHGDALGAG